MFQSSMNLVEARKLGTEKAIEQLKFFVVQQLRTAGEDEKNYKRSVYETDMFLSFVEDKNIYPLPILDKNLYSLPHGSDVVGHQIVLRAIC